MNIKKEKEKLGRNIKTFRLNNNLSERFVSRYLNIDINEYLLIEKTGNISGYNLQLLAKLYNCSIDSFFISINLLNSKYDLKEILK